MSKKIDHKIDYEDEFQILEDKIQYIITKIKKDSQQIYKELRYMRSDFDLFKKVITGQQDHLSRQKESYLKLTKEIEQLKEKNK